MSGKSQFPFLVRLPHALHSPSVQCTIDRSIKLASAWLEARKTQAHVCISVVIRWRQVESSGIRDVASVACGEWCDM